MSPYNGKGNLIRSFFNFRWFKQRAMAGKILLSLLRVHAGFQSGEVAAFSHCLPALNVVTACDP